jgi:hypothetical protein
MPMNRTFNQKFFQWKEQLIQKVKGQNFFRNSLSFLTCDWSFLEIQQKRQSEQMSGM